MKGRIVKISAHKIVVEGLHGVQLGDVIKTIDKTVLGEVVRVYGDNITVSLIEPMEALCVGDEVVSQSSPLCIEMAPGVMEGVYDHLQRPLNIIAKRGGIHINDKNSLLAINYSKKWKFSALKQQGDMVVGGDVIGTVIENDAFTHKIMVPHGINGRLTKIYSGEFSVEEIVATVEDEDKNNHFITMLQRLPIRKKNNSTPNLNSFLLERHDTSIRAIDSFFPLYRGGVTAVLGKAGTGKSMLIRQIVKYTDVDLIVFVGCGMRGLEIAETVSELLRFTDPKTGRSHLKRSMFFFAEANASPFARENVLYNGIVAAEYFKDMGYKVLLACDSLWEFKEAVRQGYEVLSGLKDCNDLALNELKMCLGRAGFARNFDKQGDNLGSLTIVASGNEELEHAFCFDTVIKLRNDADSVDSYPKLDVVNSCAFYDGELIKNEQQSLLLELLRRAKSYESIMKVCGREALTKDMLLDIKMAEIVNKSFVNQDCFDRLDKPMSRSKMDALVVSFNKLYSSFKAEIASGKEINEVLVDGVSL